MIERGNNNISMSKIVTFIRNSRIQSFLGVKSVKSLNQQTNHEKVNFTDTFKQTLSFPTRNTSTNFLIYHQIDFSDLGEIIYEN